MPIEIARLAEPDIPGVVSAIQAAFVNDPYNNWVYDQSQFNPERNAASLAARCRWGMRHGLYYVAKESGSDKVLGVAMWLRPQPAGQKQTWGDWLDAWWLWLNQVAVNLRHGRGGLNVKRYYLFKAAQAKAQEQVWTDPRGYYFLNIIVTVPEAQGRGIGRQLVSVVTDRADAEHMPCYLESSKAEPNMGIYKHWGFEFKKEMPCVDDDNNDKANDAVCTLYCMVREPR